MDWGLVVKITVQTLGLAVGTAAVAWGAGTGYVEALRMGCGVGGGYLVGLLRQSPMPGKLLVVAALGLGLSGCGTLPLPKALTDFTATDIDQAIVMATAAKDQGAPYRLRCYTTLKKYVVASAGTPAPTLPKGVVSAYELAAELDASARGSAALIPADLHADCAVISINLAEFAARVGAKFAPVPGAAAIGGLLR